MSKEKRCDYCRHGAHEEGKCQVVMVENADPLLFYNGLCNCDGKTQSFMLHASTRAGVETQIEKAEAAGYSVETLHDGRRITELVNEDWQRTGHFCATAFSDKLPPVSSYEEFRQRVGL